MNLSLPPHRARLLFCAALLGAGACNPAIHVSGETAVNQALQKRSAADLTRLLNRQGSPADDIKISATLWDLAWITAFQEERATRQGQGADVTRQAIEAWRQRFVAGQTAFRIRVELLNRAEITAGTDRITQLKEWTFRLRFSDGKVVPYRQVDVELSRRWKAPEKKGYHYRLDGTVHFGRRVDPSQDRWVELEAYPPDDRTPTRLRWNLRNP